MNNQMRTIVWDWVIRTFGLKVARDHEERALRVLEEAVELAQCCDVRHAQALVVVNKVFSKTKGTLRQEVGGVAITLLALCALYDYDLEATAFLELRRILNMNPEVFREKQNRKAADGTGVPCS